MKQNYFSIIVIEFIEMKANYLAHRSIPWLSSCLRRRRRFGRMAGGVSVSFLSFESAGLGGFRRDCIIFWNEIV